MTDRPLLDALEEQILVVPTEAQGTRLDQFLVASLDSVSRSQVQRAIRESRVSVDGFPAWKTGIPLKPDMEVQWTPLPTTDLSAQPQPVPFETLYEDAHLLVVSKPAGIVVHPAPGSPDGTLVNGLVLRYDDLAAWGGLRPGIVHRLDRCTSGLLVVARSKKAGEGMTAQFLERTIFKGYLALVVGERRQESGQITRAIERHPNDRKRFTSLGRSGRPAETHWQTLYSANGFSLLGVRILTGRTHQIRVHLCDDGFPIVGDETYAARSRVAAEHRVPGSLLTRGAMLHAAFLSFRHPITGHKMAFGTPPPADFLSTARLLFPESDLAALTRQPAASDFPGGEA